MRIVAQRAGGRRVLVEVKRETMRQVSEGVVLDMETGQIGPRKRVGDIAKFGYWLPYNGPDLSPEDRLRIEQHLADPTPAT